MSNVILEWTTEGDVLVVGNEPRIAAGVRGTAFDLPEGIYIPLLRAENPGNGDVSRFLDSLPTDRRVVFPSVISRKLDEMLARRGFSIAIEKGHRIRERKP